MIDKFLTERGTLNPNMTRAMSDVEAKNIREKSGVFTASINTAIYCIHKNISCKLCETCSNELSIENFIEGFKVSKRFCSVACKTSFKAIDSTSTDILTDYSLVLDKDELLASGKMARHMNALTVVDLQKKTGLITNDVNTLLYAAIHTDFKLQRCMQCDVGIDIDNFRSGYRVDQQYCSYVKIKILHIKPDSHIPMILSQIIFII